ncbi:MAG: DUF2309 domain-containing protein [Haloplanus sp.]
MSTETTHDGTRSIEATHDAIERAAASVGSVWPIHSFVTANPLSGFEDRSFAEAVAQGERLFGGRGYPSADTFREAWADGRIDDERLAAELSARGYDADADPEALLARMDAEDEATTDRPAGEDEVDRLLTKWLAAFLDEGRAEWPMPNREAGFYAAFRAVARHDREIPDREAVTSLPDSPVDAIESLLAEYPERRWESIFEHHLTALPGWTGLLKHRAESDDGWQSVSPITLAGYLAVRLALTAACDAPLAPPETETPSEDGEDGEDGEDEDPLAEAWLSAWEATYREELVDAVADAGASRAEDADDDRPAAQLVFCIDTRSEVIRRHVEAAGPYETHGYAGFFGVPMRYEGYDADVPVDACPPIVDAGHRVAETPSDDGRRAAYDRWARLQEAGEELLHGLKSNAATAFSFVESTGSGYGLALAARTLLPGRVGDLADAVESRVPSHHEFCTPGVDHDPDDEGVLPRGMTFEEQVEYAAAAFDLMGWEEFARVVAFVGHASQTANNPFGASLDCGACAGNPGGPNARVLAAICNDEEVKDALRRRGFDVPADTVFVAGEHDTTTDEVTLFAEGVPESHETDLARLRSDLESARAGAVAERTGATPEDGTREVNRRAADWAETRPEWGLAGNASFVIGPRDLTDDLHLDGRAFLHSYDWATDDEGDALEAILTGPMVVTQWINAQYYFSTVDTAVYGSGSKVTHNPVGNVGVYQGNGGDLMSGLPLQSVNAADDEPYHQPLRLSVVIHAPVERVTEILRRHDHLARLLDNGWLSLDVVDPERDHETVHYDGELSWTGMETEPERSARTETELERSAPSTQTVVADD